MAIWFIQRAGKETRLIDYLEGHGAGLEHYAKLLKEKPYLYGKHIAPHDIEVRELGTGRSRKEVAGELGIGFDTAPKLAPHDGIQAVRVMLRSCWIDKTRCAKGLLALRSYHYEWDEKRRVFGLTPEHDWSSHGCDALRTYAVGSPRFVEGETTWTLKGAPRSWMAA